MDRSHAAPRASHALADARPTTLPTYGELLSEARRLLGARRFEAADGIYRQLVTAVPQAPDAWHELGLLQVEAGRPEAAVEFVERAIALAPTNAAYQSNLGAIFRKLERSDEALACFERAVQLSPAPSAPMLSNLALALKSAGRESEALAVYDQAIAQQPDYATGHFNRANLLLTIGRVDEAVAAYRQAVELAPNDAEAHYRLGIAYYDLGQHEAALACWQQALTLRPNYPEAHRNRALVLLREGQYAAGWAEWEYRFACEGFVTRPCPEPRWDGQAAPGRRLLLHTEQGLGDTLQFIRYVAPVRELADSLLAEVQAPLLPLLAASGYGPLLTKQGEQTSCDVQCPLLSVPFALAGRHDEPYWNGPYLKPSAHLASKWESRVRETDDLQVGISWAGNPDHPHDRFRSLRLAELAPLARIPGVRLISLQKGAAAEQMAELPADAPVVDFGESFDATSGSFMDTAAVIKHLDLVISVDTAIGHLAGGMGTPVWLMVEHTPDWRWRLSGAQTPWYPTMRLFRQRQLHVWDDVFRDVEQQLQQLVAQRST